VDVAVAPSLTTTDCVLHEVPASAMKVTVCGGLPLADEPPLPLLHALVTSARTTTENNNIFLCMLPFQCVSISYNSNTRETGETGDRETGDRRGNRGETGDRRNVFHSLRASPCVRWRSAACSVPFKRFAAPRNARNAQIPSPQPNFFPCFSRFWLTDGTNHYPTSQPCPSKVIQLTNL